MQSKLQSAIEAVANTIIGMAIAFSVQLIVYPVFHIHISLIDNLWVTLIFTAVGIARSYALRRLFNHLHRSKL